MYPRNNATPPRLAIGQVVQISDGAVQSSGVTITVRVEGGSEATGGGTTAYGADGTVYYTPTQAETNYTAFVVIANKASCFSASITVVTTATAVSGTVDIGAVSGDATAADNLELDYDGTGYAKANSTIGTATDVTNGVTASTVTDKTGYSISGTKTTLDDLNDVSTAEVNTQVDLGLSEIGLDHLVAASVTGTDITDNSIIAYMVSKSATADWDSFVNTTDALEAIADSAGGDATAANQTTIINHLTDVKGTSFVKDTHSLTDITADVTGINGDAMRGTDNALLAASAPTNFGDLAITASTGRVTIGTNADKTGYSISGSITTLDGLNDPTAAAIADAVLDESLSAHNTGGTLGKAIRQIKEGVVSAESTVNDASATTTSFVTALTSAVDDFYNDKILVFIGGALTGQARIISDYNGTTKAITFDEATTSAPANGDGFIILGIHSHTLTQIKQEVRTEMDSNSTQLAAIVADTGTTLPATLSAIQGASFDTSTDSLEAIRDRGDAAWTGSGGGGDATEAKQDTIISAIGTITDLGSGSDIANNLADIAGATFVTGTDSLEAIRNRGDAAWAGAGSALLMQNTTIATLASQTSFTLTDGSTDDDAYNGLAIVITDSATSTQKAVGVIENYVGATKTITLRTDPGIFTIAAGDTVDILACITGALSASSGVEGWLG
jgi:hypothetical protein